MTSTAVVAGRGEPEVAKLSLMRRSMVRRTIEGAAVPSFYLRLSADVTDLLLAREALREGGAGRVPSVNDFIVRAAALELRGRPAVNSAYLDGEVATYPRVNVGVAVAVDGGGLVVPAIYDADTLDVHAISAAVREVVDLAVRRRLSRELLADATFTVSNLGMYGIEDFDPIINPPQAAILGVGRAMADPDGRSRLRLSLGCDHRVLTGAEGAPFLAGVRDRLERPADLLSAPGGEPAGERS